MLKSTIYRSGLAAIWISILLAGCASPKTQESAKTNVDEAKTTLANFLKDPDMTWLQKNIHSAKAVLVSPRVLKAGFIYGGSGGNAVVVARGGTPEGWSGPAFYKLASGSIGFQAGAESAEVVMLVMSDKALNSLLSSQFKLGGDVSVTAGPVGAGAEKLVNSDMVVFSKAKGLYGGLNLEGTSISVDDDGNRNFYGKPATPVDILVKHTVTNPMGNSLARVVSQTGTASGASPSGTSSSGTK